MSQILSTRQLTPITKSFVLAAPLIAAAAHPGQFVILRVREGGERIPITIADVDPAAGTLTLVIQAVGATTRRICALEVGEAILDVAGPLGSPIVLPRGGVVGVGGGFGSAALLGLMRAAAAAGRQTTVVLGARSAELLIFAAELGAVVERLEICTDDGSAGFHGFVTQRLEQLIAEGRVSAADTVVAIGPMVMMRAVAQVTRGPNIRTLVSMDPLMIDGTGMCGGCRVLVGGVAQFACVEGPVFDAHQVDFTLAMRRNQAYVREEAVALEHQQRLEALAAGIGKTLSQSDFLAPGGGR
jgi:ferredoxin--NADP+ reductase